MYRANLSSKSVSLVTTDHAHQIYNSWVGAVSVESFVADTPAECLQAIKERLDDLNAQYEALRREHAVVYKAVLDVDNAYIVAHVPAKDGAVSKYGKWLRGDNGSTVMYSTSRNDVMTAIDFKVKARREAMERALMALHSGLGMPE